MTEVPFPPLSGAADSVGVVATWFVADGASVATGDVLAEVQVDKVAADVPAPAAGRVRRLVPEGAEVRAGDPIATVG